MAYSPVYSVPFIWYTDAEPQTDNDVAVGYTAVVRELSCFSSIAATFVQLQVVPGPGFDAVTVISLEVAGLQVSNQWQGRIVVPGGGSMHLVVGSASAGTSVYVGGYILANTLS